MENKLQNTNSAAAQGLASCSRCLTLNHIHTKHCMVCGKKLHLRSPASLQKTLALVATALLFYIPANLYPIMQTNLLGQEIPSTIIGGVLLFFAEGSYFVAAVIFTASIIIPIAKMIIIIWLCYCVNSSKYRQQKDLTHIYEAVEFIGKWSMIDVFVVAILVALVQLSGIMSIHPGLAVQAFAIVVILTMLAAQQFDIRLIWDKLESGAGSETIESMQNSRHDASLAAIQSATQSTPQTTTENNEAITSANKGTQ